MTALTPSMVRLGLCNVGGQHHLPPLSRHNRLFLGCKGEITVKGGDQNRGQALLPLKKPLATAISPVPGRKTNRSPSVSPALHAPLSMPPPEGPPSISRETVTDVDRVTPPLLHGYDRRIAEQFRNGSAVKSRRHDHQLQVIARAPLHVETEGQGQGRMEGPFMEFVEDRDPPTSSRNGSLWRRRVRIPSVSTSIRVADETFRSKRME